MTRTAVLSLAALLVALLVSGARAEVGPRLRENFNQGWLFARQSNGSVTLGSFDRDTSAAGRIEPRFQRCRRARPTTIAMAADHASSHLERTGRDGRVARILARHRLVSQAFQAGLRGGTASAFSWSSKASIWFPSSG